jgi:hypothetical protein
MITDEIPIHLPLDPMMKIGVDAERRRESNQDQGCDHSQRYGYFTAGGHLLGTIWLKGRLR